MVRTRREWRALVARTFRFEPEASPCSWSPARIRGAIAAEIPRFRRATLRVIRRGHNLVAELDGEWIFKFPWHPAANCAQEVALLRRLDGHLPIRIPVPVFIGRHHRFFG